MNKFSSLRDYLVYRQSKCHKTIEFLEKRTEAEIYQLSEFMSENDYINMDVGDVVFIESNVEIIDSNGNIINEWY